MRQPAGTLRAKESYYDDGRYFLYKFCCVRRWARDGRVFCLDGERAVGAAHEAEKNVLHRGRFRRISDNNAASRLALRSHGRGSV